MIPRIPWGKGTIIKSLHADGVDMFLTWITREEVSRVRVRLRLGGSGKHAAVNRLGARHWGQTRPQEVQFPRLIKGMTTTGTLVQMRLPFMLEGSQGVVMQGGGEGGWRGI